MPLRDHFSDPRSTRRHWQGVHGQWPAMIVLGLMRALPNRYFAEPRVNPAGNAEVDVSTFEEQGESVSDAAGNGRDAVSVANDIPAVDEYEVRVFDAERQARLVAAVEIVSPANKDRPEHRRLFVAKCAAFLQAGVAVTIIDLVTTRHFNLYRQLLELLGQDDPSVHGASLYAASCRWTRRDNGGLLETWSHELALGQPLPTLPLWLAEALAVPLELEESYEETCRALRMP
jgi:hypothetical protein